MFYNSLQSATRGAGEARRRARRGAGGAGAGSPDDRSPDGRGEMRLRRTPTSGTARTGSCCPPSTCTSRPGRPSRWSARPARASRRSPSWSPGSTTRPAGVVPARRRRPARPVRRRPAARRGHGRPGELPVLRHDRRQHPVRPAGRDRRRRCEAAARAIGADEFIDALPDGYDTDVRKRGGRLSAGQRQLVAFARAFLADPAVLILDEATSSLDIPSERLVQRALRTILRSRTAIVIAHRLSTVEIADRVLVLDGGRIVEDGTPDALITTGGRYATPAPAVAGQPRIDRSGPGSGVQRLYLAAPSTIPQMSYGSGMLPPCHS